MGGSRSTGGRGTISLCCWNWARYRRPLNAERLDRDSRGGGGHSARGPGGYSMVPSRVVGQGRTVSRVLSEWVRFSPANTKRHPTTRPDRQRLFLNCSLRNADLRVAHGNRRVEPSRGRGLTVPNRVGAMSSSVLAASLGAA